MPEARGLFHDRRLAKKEWYCVSCWPVAAGVAGVVREAARLENSLAVFACCSLRFSATGPMISYQH